MEEELAGIGNYEYGWHDKNDAGASAQRGLNESVVRDISAKKNEPQWMLDLRLKGLKLFEKKPMPNWGSDLADIDFDNIKYFVRSTEKQASSWEELPEDIKNTYDRLGIPEAEKQRLVAGVAGTGFTTTPFLRADALSEALGFTADGGVWVKDETHHVAGSHKARHLFGILLHLVAAERCGVTPWSPATRPPLAIASCGNAAIAASTLAAAVQA